MASPDSSDTILIIEDDEQISYILTFMLEREGYEIIGATDGQMAHDMINDIQPPKLILLDIMLPFIDGFALIKLIRSLANWQHVPVIMLSSKFEEKDIVQALESGANDYVVKPFQPMELLARIKRHI